MPSEYNQNQKHKFRLILPLVFKQNYDFEFLYSELAFSENERLNIHFSLKL